MNNSFDNVSDILKDQTLLESDMSTRIVNRLRGYFGAPAKQIIKKSEYITKSLKPIGPLVRKYPRIQKAFRRKLKKYLNDELEMGERNFLEASKVIERYMIKHDMIPTTSKSLSSTQSMLFTLNTAYKLKEEQNFNLSRSLVVNYAKQRLDLFYKKDGLARKKSYVRYAVAALLLTGLIFGVATQLPRGYTILKTLIILLSLIALFIVFTWAGKQRKKDE